MLRLFDPKYNVSHFIWPCMIKLWLGFFVTNESTDKAIVGVGYWGRECASVLRLLPCRHFFSHQCDMLLLFPAGANQQRCERFDENPATKVWKVRGHEEVSCSTVDKEWFVLLETLELRTSMEIVDLGLLSQDATSLHRAPQPPQGGRFVLTNQISIPATKEYTLQQMCTQCAEQCSVRGWIQNMNIERARPCSESRIDWFLIRRSAIQNRDINLLQNRNQPEKRNEC